MKRFFAVCLIAAVALAGAAASGAGEGGEDLSLQNVIDKGYAAGSASSSSPSPSTGTPRSRSSRQGTSTVSGTDSR